MPFPPVQRVIYGKNSLDRVICQLRFPPILRIDADIPADFQDQVRTQFPHASETSEFKVESSSAIGDRVPAELIQQVIQSSGTKNYEFSSEDGYWKINLTRTFIALSTTEYRRWEEFRDRLMLPLEALNKIYTPNYFARVGLRYINIIQRSQVGLSDVPWQELLSPTVIGLLGSPDITAFVEGLESWQQIRLAEQGGNARIAVKLQKAKNDQENCFILDSDFFDIKRTEIADAVSKLNFLHLRPSRFIRWAITDRLHHAMEPAPL